MRTVRAAVGLGGLGAAHLLPPLSSRGTTNIWAEPLAYLPVPLGGAHPSRGRNRLDGQANFAPGRHRHIRPGEAPLALIANVVARQTHILPHHPARPMHLRGARLVLGVT